MRLGVARLTLRFFVSQRKADHVADEAAMVPLQSSPFLALNDETRCPLEAAVPRTCAFFHLLFNSRWFFVGRDNG
jgi:hypothetical protein